VEKVGIRKVKARLSAYLRRVRRGETILVTQHGRTIAELRPHDDTSEQAEAAIEAVFRRLVETGKLRLPSRARGHPMDVWRGWTGIGGRVDSLELLQRTREESTAWPASRTSRRAR
jgi:prevent-host-death family protein